MKRTPLAVAARWLGVQCSSERAISHVTVDSRQVGPGSLFFALPGSRTDGHQFVEEVLAAGGCAVVSQFVTDDPHVMTVDDTLQAMQTLATHYLSQHNPLVVGITGSNGKTTTKDFTKAVLSSKYCVHATAGNFNNEIGVPLTILSMDEPDDALVLEMGMRGSGQIAALTKMAPLDVAVITNIGPVHLELLGSLEAVADAKGEILRGLKPGGTAVLNGDDQRVREQWEVWRGPAFWTSSFQQNQDLFASDLQIDSRGYPEFNVHFRNTTQRVRLPLPGRHNVSNAVAALGVGVQCGIPLDQGADALQTASSSPMRMEVFTVSTGCLVVNDAYNASPASMEAALSTVEQMGAVGIKAGVLGDMLELGGLAPASHAQAGRHAAKVFDEILYVGRLGGFFREGLLEEGFPMEKFEWVTKVDDAVQWVKLRVEPGNIILFKASRGIGLESLLPVVEGKERGHE